MANLEIAERIAENLRQEPYHLFRNDCLTKSLRFRNDCRRRGMDAHLVWCVLGVTKARFPVIGEVSMPVCLHFWGEVEGRRFETSRPLGAQAPFGIVPAEIQPIIAVRLR